jgi:hypothetical protein
MFTKANLLETALSQFNPLHNLIPHFSNIHFNNSLKITLKFHIRYLCFMFFYLYMCGLLVYAALFDIIALTVLENEQACLAATLYTRFVKCLICIPAWRLVISVFIICILLYVITIWLGKVSVNTTRKIASQLKSISHRFSS